MMDSLSRRVWACFFTAVAVGTPQPSVVWADATGATASPPAAATAVRAFDWPDQLMWSARFVGVEQTAVLLTRPRPLRLHAFRVDLAADGVGVCTDRANGDRPEETDGCFTTTFLADRGCQIAINGAPFWPGRANEGEPQNVVGLVIERGELVSPFDASPARAAMVYRDEVASIVSPPIDLDGIDTAIGGYGVVVRDGEVVRDETTPLDVLDGEHPRTGIGLSDGGRTLWLVVVDGRQPGYSEGVTLRELGELFRLLGADDAMNLDGGGTTAMAVQSADGAPELVNQAIDGRVVGQQRVSASHFGVLAKPLAATAVAEP